MPETDKNLSADNLSDNALPIPVQIFLWKQLSPFVRPKLGKLHEASCAFCQQAITGHHELKEACKWFEKVLVQNIQSEIKSDLIDSIKSIPRWRLIQASLPHVMHAVTNVLYNRIRDGSIQTLGAVETKLLYTLHWIILDASDECADEDSEKGIFHSSPFYYLFSIPTITLFVYLLAPICHNLKESDFTNFRLENGLKIWQALWEFRHPDAPCFTTHCKPKPKLLNGKHAKAKQFGDVFVGRKPSCQHAHEEPVSHESPSVSQVMSASSSEQQPLFSVGGTPNTVTITATITKIDDEGAWVSSPKDTVFPETIPEESSSTEEEHVVIFRLPSLHESDGFLRESSIYTAETSIIQLAMRKSGRNNNVKLDITGQSATGDDKPANVKPSMHRIGSTDKDSIESSKVPSIEIYKDGKSTHSQDLAGATFLDVAVLRCLFITHWQEEGIYWALHYMYNRLREISDENVGQQQSRKRSNSLPIPKIEVSLYQNNDSKKNETNKDFIEIPEPKDISLLAESPFNNQSKSDESVHKRTASEKSKRRMKIADLKTFVETKLLSKSDKALEKIGQEEHHKPLGHVSVGETNVLNDHHRSLDTGDDTLSKSQAQSAKTFEASSNLVKGKSMPSLRFVEYHQHDIQKQTKIGHTQPMTNPIITVTVHTPTPSPDYLLQEGSMDSQLDAASLSGSKLGNWQERKSSLTRSQTDSNITYGGDETPEAPGAACYITADGDIDFQVILQAIHKTAMRENASCTLRVLEVILNLLELLMDMGVLKQCLREEVAASTSAKDADSPHKTKTKTSHPAGEETDKLYKTMNAHRLVMTTIIRILKHLGCPHGCSEGQRGPAAEFLRTQCQNILSKLSRASSKQFKACLRDYVKFQPLTDLMELFHSYVGYCIDPSSLLSPLSVGGGGIKGVEGTIMSHVFKPLVTRFVESIKEIKTPDSMGMYCEIRQFMTYVKEGHGGVFRRVALSALIDTADRPTKKEVNIQTTRVIRHVHQSDVDDQPEAPSDAPSDNIDERGARKLLFKKRSTSSTCASLLETEAEELTRASQSPIGNLRKKHHILTPRQSERALGIVLEPTVVTLKSKKFKLGGIVNWFKKGESFSADELDNPDNGDSFTDTSSFIKQSSKNFYRKGSGRSNVTQSIQKAKKRMEDKFKFVLKKGKKKDGNVEESGAGYFSRKNSFDFGETSRESEFVVLKERKLVSTDLVYKGLTRFSFLLETCPPGTVPDAHLLAAVLDLVLGHRLEEMINEDKNVENDILNMVGDEQKQKELLVQDDEEDFLDEASISFYGVTCPMALRLIACMLLHEITAFLRETYQTLPKTSKIVGKDRPPPWERLYSREANRRWSMALSSMGYSQTSAQSLQSIAGDRDSGQTERKISFVLHEPDNESEMSSNTTVTMQAMMQMDDIKRTGQQPRPYLLRRGTAAPGGGSFKRRSLKLRRGTKEGRDMEMDWKATDGVKRTDSIQSKRKVSSLSDRSDTSEPGVVEGSEEESPGVLSDEQPPESPNDSNDIDDTAKNMPWLKVMVQVANSFYYYCPHQNFCHPFCYRRVMRGCNRLIKAVRKVYGEEFGVTDDKLITDYGRKKKANKKEKNQNRKVSDQTSSTVSPIRRKDSVGKKDRIEKNFEFCQGKYSTKESGKDIPENDTGTDNKSSNECKPVDVPPILKYITTQVKDAFQAPFSTLLKGAVILTEENFVNLIPVAWELLLESNQEVSASAASLFILGAVKVPQQVSDMLQHGLSHPDCSVRINAILRFQVLWKMRYQIWPRMEENAHALFKVPPPGIEFTLPSPKIGIESLEVVDSPWELLVKTKVEEVTINQERHRSLVTATKTRKKQQTELIKMALQAQDDKKREEREKFLITTIPITIQAAHEPSLHHVGEEHEQEDDEQVDGQPRNATHHLHSAHSLFPSCLCSAVVQIINLLDDPAVSADGNAVYEVAYTVIWTCLVEDSALFLRYILERLTRDKQELMFKILRHLIRFIPKLPQQAAFALYNYIIGYVMFYVRSPHEDGQELIGAALSILWMVVHSVHGIMFKDLKQILRKEQCDASILLTANVPSAKKIIVHGPQEPDAGGIPSQFPVQEDTQFCQILREALDFFGVDENKHTEYFLVDYKTHQIRNPSSYVRDYYFFKRSQYPQLELVHMKPDVAFNALQKQELAHKFVEIGKVLLTWAILKNVDMVVQRVVFLHEELMKLPSFPRKALESDLELYKGGPLGKQLLGLDVLHKFMWVRLIARMFEAMAGNFAYSGDIHLFVNVLNGALVLHSEDACILRYVTATYINAAFHFKNIFSTNGYLLIMPTLLKIYSNHQTNKLITTTVEYAVKQFYLMNRKPFILQMFGSVSAMLDTEEEGTYGDAHKIQSSCLFNLLLSLETPSPDPLNIGELVKEDKPLKAIDFCYHDENEMVTILDCISMCVMVVSYASESVRGYQMLIILEAILPCYVKQIQLPSYNKEGKTEREIINQLAVALKTLVNNCEALTKSYNGPYRSSPEHKGSSQRNYSRGPYSPGFDFEDDSHSKFMSEHSRAKSMYEHDVEDSEVLRAEYRRPRDVLLSLVGEFMCKATSRLQELNKKNNQDGKILELLDIKSHIRLADIAHTLLKVSPYDPESMGCRGLQHYMTYILPATEWSNDAMRPALVTILRRLDKVFQKISKKPSIRRNTDWDAAAGLLKGIYDTMVKYPYIIHWSQIRALINTCQSLIVSDSGTSEGVSSATAALMSQAPPPHFCSMVVRLIALQVQNTPESSTLEQVCGGSSTFPTQEKTESMIINLILPLCLRVGSGRKDVTHMKQSDISYALTMVLHAMSPPNTKSAGPSGSSVKPVAEIRTGSLTFTGTRDTKTSAKINTSLYQVSFLALKIMAICFEGELMNEWTKIGRTMRELGKRNEAATFLWDFLDFVVTHRTTLFILMQPFIFQKLAQPPISDFERNMHTTIRNKMRSIGLQLPKSKGALLMELAHEMKMLKQELDESVESPSDQKKTETVTTCQMTTEIPTYRHQRHSLIGLFTGEGHYGSKSAQNHDLLHSHLKESSTSTSHVSTPNQPTNISTSEAHETHVNGQSTPSNAPDRSSQRSSVSDEHGIPIPKSESLMFHKVHKLRFVSSVEMKHSSGETSTTPLSPVSPVDDSSSEIYPNKSRLQRIKPQSRKTFRLRRSKKSTKVEISHTKLESEVPTPSHQYPPYVSPPLTPIVLSQSSIQPVCHPLTPSPTPSQQQNQKPKLVKHDSLPDSHRLRIATRTKIGDGSWDEDSAISQTSSTSGYRESYPVMHLKESLETSPKAFPPLASPDVHSFPSISSTTTMNNFQHMDNSSPDCSLNENGEKTALLGHADKSSSQHSLLMIFEKQDETSFI